MFPSTSGGGSLEKNIRLNCFVPMCYSNSKNFPEKKFLTVPNKQEERENWMRAARVDPKYGAYSSNSVIRCCEDHFELEKDAENWIKYRLMGGKIFLRKGVVPHIFKCQGRIKPTIPLLEKKQAHNALNITVSPLAHQSPIEKTITTKEKAIQAVINPYKRSKAIQVARATPQNTVALSPIKSTMKHKSTSPIKANLLKIIDSESIGSSGSDYILVGTQSTTESFQSEDSLNKETILKLTLAKILAKPRLYIGVPLDCIFIIDLLENSTHLPLAHIFLTLKKLRLNEPFSILADEFGFHESTASRIFSSNIHKFAQILVEFIIKPSCLSVLENLPLAFRMNYSNTYCIIDCLEIEIETPTNALHQTLTYSSYKKCNTLKYLISATPAGVVNFISKGFGGRTSDIIIFEESKFLDILPPGASIMADRGFKHIERLLLKKYIKLERPPSVKSSEKSSRANTIITKQIASLRIHIERVIRRLREFSFLKPHACTDHNLIPHLDDAIIICCALINLQPLIVK